MTFKFQAKVVPSGNAAAVEVPKDGVESFGAGARPPVAISINGHSWRSRIAVKDGKYLVGISAANRRASSISMGDLVEVLVALDEAPRTVEEPADLTEALLHNTDFEGASTEGAKIPAIKRRAA